MKNVLDYSSGQKDKKPNNRLKVLLIILVAALIATVFGNLLINLSYRYYHPSVPAIPYTPTTTQSS